MRIMKKYTSFTYIIIIIINIIVCDYERKYIYIMKCTNKKDMNVTQLTLSEEAKKRKKMNKRICVCVCV